MKRDEKVDPAAFYIIFFTAAVPLLIVFSLLAYQFFPNQKSGDGVIYFTLITLYFVSFLGFIYSYRDYVFKRILKVYMKFFYLVYLLGRLGY